MKRLLPLFTCIAVLALAALPASLPAEDKRYELDLGGRPVLGPDTAPVTIVEFLDFQ